MRTTLFPGLLTLLSQASAVHAQFPDAPSLPFDTPQTMRSMEAVCTGAGADARNDPRWISYPLRVEVAGTQGQFLGEAEITLTKGDEAIVSVRCGGPWVLFRIEPGTYRVTASAGGAMAASRVTVGGKGQARVVLRFPGQGGTVSPEYKPKTG